MIINRTGFVQTTNGLSIDKDSEAQLTYTFDWTSWLDGDTLATAEYSVAARINDPLPVTIVNSGIDAGMTQTYVELAGGADNKTYIVTVKITTANGLIDRRSFRVNVVARSA